MVCRQQVVGLRDVLPEIERRGAGLVVIGNGPADEIAGFRKITSFTGRLLADPSCATYRAAGLVAGLTTILDPRSIVRTIRALFSGVGVGRVRGSAVQQGGTFVLGPGDVERFAWRDRFSGDHAPVDRVLVAID